LQLPLIIPRYDESSRAAIIRRRIISTFEKPEKNINRCIPLKKAMHGLNRQKVLHAEGTATGAISRWTTRLVLTMIAFGIMIYADPTMRYWWASLVIGLLWLICVIMLSARYGEALAMREILNALEEERANETG